MKVLANFTKSELWSDKIRDERESLFGKNDKYDMKFINQVRIINDNLFMFCRKWVYYQDKNYFFVDFYFPKLKIAVDVNNTKLPDMGIPLLRYRKTTAANFLQDVMIERPGLQNQLLELLDKISKPGYKVEKMLSMVYNPVPKMPVPQEVMDKIDILLKFQREARKIKREKNSKKIRRPKPEEKPFVMPYETLSDEEALAMLQQAAVDMEKARNN